MRDKSQTSGAIIDCHVHLYDCFDIHDFLTGANRNLRSAGYELRSSDDFMSVLILTETSREVYGLVRYTRALYRLYHDRCGHEGG